MKKTPVVFSVTSGKGGVGKTNVSVNLAYCLQKRGFNTLLLDADLGLGNVDVLLGIAPKYNLSHLFLEGVEIEKIVYTTEYGFQILPSASGVMDLLNLSSGQKLELIEAMDILEEKIEFLLVDTSAGINDNVIYFNLAVQHRIVVITPDPTSLTDSYALMRVLYMKHGIKRFHVVVNLAKTSLEARNIFQRVYNVCDKFLPEISLNWLGAIPKDPIVPKAVVNQKPFCHLDLNSLPCKSIYNISEKILSWEREKRVDGNIKFFWKKLLFDLPE